MKETKYFEICDTSSMGMAIIMETITSRCAGASMNTDKDNDWSVYENVDISFVRSSKPMPKAMEQHNQVSDYLWEFTVEELASDYNSPDTNSDVEDIINAVKLLPVGRVSSHFFVKVELS